MKTLSKRRSRTAPTPERLKAAIALVGRMNAAVQPPLRLDPTRLDQAEQAELVTLTGKAGKASAYNLNELTAKERARLERLTERLAGLPDGELERRRRDAAALREIAKLGAEARRPPRKPRDLLPAGSVVLGPELGAELATGRMWAYHVELLVVLMLQIEAAVAWAPQSRIEGSHDRGDLTLIVDAVWGPFGKSVPAGEETGNAGRWKETLDDLVRANWLVLDRRGRELHIRRGPRTSGIAVGGRR